MAKAKMMVYPYLAISEKGEVEGVFCQSYAGKDAISSIGGFYIHLPPMEVEVTHPDDVRPACIALLQHDKKEKTAEHQKLMTHYQFLQNQLLGLAHSDIIDKAE